MRVLIGLIVISGCFAAVAYGAARQGTADHDRPGATPAVRKPAKSGERRTVQPAKPKINQHPETASTSTSARFTFSDREPRVRFQCRLDRPRWQACRSPVSFASLAVGSHVFSVRAINPRGRRSRATKFRWRLFEPMPFEITQWLSGLADLYPGAPAQGLPVTIQNPNPVPIFVTGLQAYVSADPPGCGSAENLALVPSSASSAAPLKVPAGGLVELPAQGVAPPTIQLRDLPINQDACQGVRFPLRFTGSAHR
jgi:hypothetical protein